MRFVALILAALPCGLAPAQAGTFWVDPVGGIDTPAAGTSAQPFKTLTYAVSRTSPTSGFWTFELRPGTYSATGGESFPIALPARCVIEADAAAVAPNSRQVSFVVDGDVFLFAPGVTGVLELSDLAFEARNGCVLSAVVDGTGGLVSVRGCSLRNDDCLRVEGKSGANLDVSIDRCELDGTRAVCTLRGDTGAVVRLHVDGSSFLNGDAALTLESDHNADLTSTTRNSRLVWSSGCGVQCVSANGGAIAMRAEHCLFQGLGLKPGGRPAYGAIVDDVRTLGLLPNHEIYNSIFDGNGADAPDGAQANYRFGVNLIQSANLVGVGGNVFGSASFVDGSHGDFHLAPGSTGIDLGNANHMTSFADLDGDPRSATLAGPPDLGPDEYHGEYVYAAEHPSVGGPLTLRTTTAASELFGLVVGTKRGPGFGAGQFHLAGLIIPTPLVGTARQDGVGELQMTVPNDPGLIGLELYWQGIYVTPPHLGSNAWRTVVRP